MPKPRRDVLAVLEQASSPPHDLAPSQRIACVIEAKGKNLYTIELCEANDKARLLVELPARFRSTLWIKRGGYVVVDIGLFADRENKLGGEIVNVIRDEKIWRKMPYWPADFVINRMNDDKSDASDDDSVTGKMPPSESDHEEGTQGTEI